jgi:sulfite exporter TauE/SafE
MCGGIVGALAMQGGGGARPAWTLHLAYNTGRIASYAIAGAVAGALGSLSLVAEPALPLGLLWGWLPCGLVYSALVSALATGSATRGAAAMLAFGLGTLPNLLLAGYVFARFRSFAQARAVRLLSGLLVLGFGLLGLWRAATFPAG